MTVRRPRDASRSAFSVLFVCTANICRSPFAAQYFMKLLEDARASGDIESDVEIEVFSRGVLARPGYAIDPVMSEIALDLGLDTSSHVSASVSVDDLERADLVVCMERRHTPLVTELLPRAVQKTMTLRTLGALASQELPDEVLALRDVRERAAWLLSTRGLVPIDPANVDIADPYRRSRQTYDASVQLITADVEAVARVLTQRPE